MRNTAPTNHGLIYRKQNIEKFEYNQTLYHFILILYFFLVKQYVFHAIKEALESVMCDVLKIRIKSRDYPSLF